MDQLVNFIIRPPRAEYSPKDDLLDEEFMLKGRWFRRKDLEVVNGGGKKLQCSHYMPLVIPEGKALPCVIYCHGNSGCRADASEAAIILLPSNITVFTLDFSGSGLSEGEHVTLGWNEKEDLRAVVDYLRTDSSVSRVGLWGRSMGAVTSLMYGAEDPSVAGMVLDSPFANLVDLMMELVDMYKYPLPKFTVKLAIQHMRKIVKKKANFDIMDLDTVQVAKCCFVPVLFGHATDDDFIQPRHSDIIYDSYVGDKNIIKFDGDHNSPRPQFYFDSITIFFHNVLCPPKDVPDDRSFHDFLDQGHWHPMHDIEYRFPELPRVNRAVSTEDAIAQLRSRRHLSRIEVPTCLSSQENSGGAKGQAADIDHGSSSSQLSVADLPNDHRERQLSPNMEEDDYVEYSFDSLPDIPCTVEDEERMVMEAIIESLKDLELKRTQEDSQPNASSNTPQSVDGAKDGIFAVNGPEETIVNSISTICDTSSEDYKDCNHGPQTMGEDCSDKPSSSSAASAGSMARDADTPDSTRATLVVQKSRSSNIMDGLTQKWGFNFFKNSGRE